MVTMVTKMTPFHFMFCTENVVTCQNLVGTNNVSCLLRQQQIFTKCSGIKGTKPSISHTQLSVKNSWQTCAFSPHLLIKCVHVSWIIYIFWNNDKLYFCLCYGLVSWDFEACAVCRTVDSTTCHGFKSTKFYFGLYRCGEGRNHPIVAELLAN